MTGQIDLLEDIKDIDPISVLLPAGSNAQTTQQGNIRLTSLLTLMNVYLFPGFHTNLISFGQLVADNFLVGQVTDKLFFYRTALRGC